MTDPRFQRVRALFEAAIVLPAAERGAFLDRECAGDEALRREVTQMLAADAISGDDFLASPLAPDNSPRPRRLGDFELFEELGRGGMGVVYRARQIRFDRQVAVKVLARTLTTTDQEIQRFQREPRRIARLQHPNIVQVLVDGVDDGLHWFAMELVDGSDLQHQLDRLRASDRPDRPPARIPAPGQAGHTTFCARLCADVALALHTAHQSSIVHRDIKPANLLLDQALRVRVTDFGLARDESLGSLTKTGEIAGTPHYMSPEQARLLEQDIDHRTDIYSLGVVLYELLTLERPYEGGSVHDVRSEILKAAPEPVRRRNRDVPRDLELICLKAMSRDPADRYATAAALADDLERFLGHREVRARRPSLRRRLRSAVRAAPRTTAAAVMLLVAAVGWWAADRIARAARTDEAVQTALAGGPAEELPRDRLPLLAETIRGLLGSDAPDAAHREALQQRLQELQTEAARLHQRGRALVARGAGSPRGTPLDSYQSPAPEAQVEGMELVTLAKAVDPSLTGAQEVARQHFPQIAVQVPDGAAPNTEVPFRIQGLDPVTGQPRTVAARGTAPAEVTLPPGLYRVILGQPDAFAERTLTLGSPGRHPVDQPLILTGDAIADMVRIEAGTARIGQRVDGATLYAVQDLDHPSFWIDRFEVTCGQYQEFVTAEDARIPKPWGDGYRPEWRDLPVLGVRPEEAMRYAAWRGKRLPSWTEWQIAARGPDGRLFPWGDDPAPMQEMTSIGYTSRDRPAWQEALQPVGTVDVDISYYGVHDMLGNPLEWTETPYVALFDDLPFPVLPWRIRGGAGWTSPRNMLAALDVLTPGSPLEYNTGFRCAKSDITP